MKHVIGMFFFFSLFAPLSGVLAQSTKTPRLSAQPEALSAALTGDSSLWLALVGVAVELAVSNSPSSTTEETIPVRYPGGGYILVKVIYESYPCPQTQGGTGVCVRIVRVLQLREFQTPIVICDGDCEGSIEVYRSDSTVRVKICWRGQCSEVFLNTDTGEVCVTLGNDPTTCEDIDDYDISACFDECGEKSGARERAKCDQRCVAMEQMKRLRRLLQQSSTISAGGGVAGW